MDIPIANGNEELLSAVRSWDVEAIGHGKHSDEVGSINWPSLNDTPHIVYAALKLFKNGLSRFRRDAR